jgi:fibronectin type 3 domain-containing protein
VRPAIFVALAFSLLIGSCGYVGPVLPPSPELPLAITNLAATERGDQIVITFSTPTQTTDALPIVGFSNIDLRVGPAVTPFDFGQWANSARQYEVTPPPRGDRDDPQPHPISKSIPVSQWEGKKIDIAVRTGVKKNGHFSQWSNRVVMDVVPPLNPPVVKAEATREGYRLTWPEERPALHFQVSRQGPTDKAPVQIGVAEKPDYVDTTAQWDTRYVYTVIAQQGSAVSLASQPVVVDHPDTFAPTVPSEITALATPDSIELSWPRSPESDLKGYYLYRAAAGGKLERLGDLLTLPTYSDRKVEHGKKYVYAVSAVDQKGNESEKSKETGVTF